MAMTTTSGGVDRAYEVHGEGPVLVLVHGITESRRSWDPLVPALAAHHTVVMADLRGHGESGRGPQYDLGAMASDVHELVDQLELSDVVLVGHSLGGTVVTAYAAAFGCRGVVNVDQPLALSGFQAGLRQLEPMLRGDRAAFASAITAVFDSMAGQLAGAERARVEALRRPDQDVVLGVWSVLLDASPEALEQVVHVAFGSIRAPYLSLHGIDPGEGYAAWLQELIPTASVEVWPDVGHYPHLVHPDHFLARLSAFEEQLG
jgi:pimeloyl-ACP methyl ester carboxylesterase